LAELADVNDEESRLFSGNALATKAGRSEGTTPYACGSLVGRATREDQVAYDELGI
jgi:hypothetical protein